MYRAINAGLRQGRAAWLTYLNSDDWVFDDAYARLLECAAAERADVVYGNCDYADSVGRFAHSFRAARPTQLLPLYGCGVMGFAQPAAIISRELYERLGGFDESYALSADSDFFLRALKAGAKFACVRGPAVACFRLHSGQLSNTRQATATAEQRAICGLDGSRPSLVHRCSLASWRLANLPHYALRMLRASLQAGGLRVPRTMDCEPGRDRKRAA